MVRRTPAVFDLRPKARLDDNAARHLLGECRELARATGGAFDVTSTPLSRCWGFLARDGRVPSREAIEKARALVGFDAVNLAALDGARPAVRFERPGIELNLGAIGKGYALDRVARDMRRSGVARALLSAGCSSLLAIGGRDAGWHVTVVSPGQTAGGADRLLANVISNRHAIARRCTLIQ